MRSLLIAGLVTVLLVRTAHADDGDRWDGATMGLQLTSGLAGGVLGGGLLGLVGGLIGSKSADRGNWGPPLAGAAIGVLIGGVAGITLGVQLEGDHLHGTGSWWATGLGAVGGAAALGGLAYSLETKRIPTPVVVAGAVILLLVPPVVAYHLTSDPYAPINAPLTLRF